MNDSLARKIDLIKVYEDHSCLIVDDQPEMRGAIKRMIASQGLARIDTAPNADEAISLCNAHRYTIIICDYNLGRSQDGQQLLEVLRHKHLLPPTSLFIMITAETQREMVLGAIESQPDDYVTKPFMPKQLCQRLDRLLIKHQALLPIKRLFAEKKFSEALAVCDQVIAAQSRYTIEVERLRGRILFLLGQLHKAREHYEKIIEQRPVPWAMLGLAETLVELGAYSQAEKILHKVLEQDNRYVEAHDLLARVEKQRSNFEQAQAHTQEACQLSPKSVPRHRRLAGLAEMTGDVQVSLDAYKQAIRWSHNSIDASGSDHINYARKCAEKARLMGGKLAKDQGEQALRQLRRAQELHPNETDIGLQAALVEADVRQSFKLRGAEESVEKARNLFQNSQPDDPESHLDYVRVLQGCGENEQAQEHLHALAAEFADNEQVMQRVERLSPEPISAGARAKVAKLTKTGIAAYQERNYSHASQIFKEALGLFPNHVGLNLNLVQVLLERHDQLLDEQDVVLIERCFDRIRDIPEDDPQWPRADALRSQFANAERVQPQAS